MDKHKPLFEDSDGIYNYCPTIIEEDNVRHIFYCSNLLPFIIFDYIAYRKGTKIPQGRWEYDSKVYVLEPDVYHQKGWDHIHACDPSMIGGEFYVNQHRYRYCLAYLGCNTLDCTINEIGLAFSDQIIGPWVKWEQNPYIGFSLEKEGRYWGVGQPSIVSLDKKGKFRLFYTRGDATGGHSYFVDCDFSIDGNGKHSEPKQILETGLQIDGRQDVLLNGDYMYDEVKDGYYCISDSSKRDGKFPSIITSTLQLYFAPSSFFLEGKGEWKEITKIDPSLTSFVRNHNAGLVRNTYGWKQKQDIEVIYTSSIPSTSNEELQYLWHYRLHSIIIPLR